MNDMTDGMIYLLASIMFMSGVIVGLGVSVRVFAYLADKFIDTRAFIYLCDKLERWR